MFDTLPINYVGPIFRPPSEAKSLLLQVTIGCSHNKCTFCGMYMTKKYTLNSFERIAADIESARGYYRAGGTRPRSVFLCDGDALGAPFELLKRVAARCNETFPKLARIGVYATCRNVLDKTPEELQNLQKLGINMAYLGLETGCDKILAKIRKGHTNDEMIAAAAKLRKAGIRTSIIALLGIGGREDSYSHCEKTAASLSAIAPSYLSFLSTIPIAGTPFHSQIKQGKITQLSTKELLLEMKMIIAGLCFPNSHPVILRANHVSNYFPLAGDLPMDQRNILGIIDAWLQSCPEGVYPDIDPRAL